MATPEELLTAVDEVISDGVRRGLLHNDVEDDVLDGRHVTVAGRRLVNFGSCSYLGLETDPRMKAAVRDAVDRHGTQFSSSRAYASAPLYRVAEAELAELFGRPVIVTPSTSMGHIAAMPTLIGSRDALVLDHQAHHSVQTAAKLVQAGGARVELIPHNDLRTLERRLVAYRGTHRRVWYAVDGLYSMYADFFPAAELDALAARHENLWLYVDDAHAFSWTGASGRGYALEHLSPGTLARTVVAGIAEQVLRRGRRGDHLPRRGVAPAGGDRRRAADLLRPGAAADARRDRRLGPTAPHARDRRRQQLLRSRIALFNRLAAAARLPLVSDSEAPIRYVGAGVASVAYRLDQRLREAGFFVSTATFPAVPAKRCGARLTITAHHTEDDIAGVVAALATHLPRRSPTRAPAWPTCVARSPASSAAGPRCCRRPRAVLPVPRPAPPELRLQRVHSIDDLDAVEWDALLGHRGAFDAAALRALESVFADPAAAPEDRWAFTYLVVRDTDGTPVAATFLTTARWKDDMLSPAHVSREVERRRAENGDPWFLTSPMVGTGSLLTEGDHLYLDRTRDWRTAVRLVLQAARAEEDAAGAAGVGAARPAGRGRRAARVPARRGPAADPRRRQLGARRRVHDRRGVPGRPAPQAPLPPAHPRPRRGSPRSTWRC